MKIRSTKDFYAGLIFIFFGGFFMCEALNYSIGSTMRMGPGYFPILLGGILVVLGIVIAVRPLWAGGEPTRGWAVRPLLLVLGGVVAFGFLIQPLGLVLAIVALVVISSFASWEFRILEVICLSLVLAALAVGVFVYGLGLPFRLWWFK